MQISLRYNIKSLVIVTNMDDFCAFKTSSHLQFMHKLSIKIFVHLHKLPRIFLNYITITLRISTQF